uniref:Putative vitellogenin-2 n=1 Tax=Amblyomma triste TaxID=251400 RepID=A0A023GMU7_AMBTT
MRLLGLLLLAAAASSFEVGKEYVYTVQGRQCTSSVQSSAISLLAWPSEARSSSSLKRTTRISRLLTFESDTFNSDDINIERHEFNYASNEHLVGALEHPFAGKFDEGKIEEIEIGKSEPLWVKNLKKGILSLFQVDLVKGRHEHHDDKEYHVKEDSLHGACDTLYIVHKEERNHIALSKVKNLEKCDNARVAVFGRMKGERCDMCEDHEAHPQYATTDVYYELEGTAQQYVIHHASEESSHLFKPHGDAKRIIIIINRTLDLDEQHDAAFHTPLPEDAVKEHSLQQEFAQSDT